jgi:CheY-like chemotaxis protein
MPRLLLIDDDDEMRSMLRRILQRAGYETLEAADGRAGLDLLRHNPVDLLITDIIMPDMEGIELILQLRQINPNLHIIAISGGGRLAPENYLELAKACGATNVLAKPFEIEQLLSSVKELLES